MEDSSTINVVKDETGKVLARVFMVNGVLHVYRTPCCTIGTYFQILSFLEEQGYKVL
jgi:hypothetical protein